MTAISPVLFAGMIAAASPSSAGHILNVDATKQAAAPVSAHLHMGTNKSPSGHTIEVNNQYLTRDGKPWLPVMGEFHFTRFPPDQWEAELLKMKAAGVEVVAAYIIWDHHEETPGHFNFTGDRDLRRFLELCAKHDLKVVERLGPWVHAEVRYGGIPDWVVAQVPLRGNDPQYMNYLKAYWHQIAIQSKGMMFKDGGPVIGVQLENEYNLTGPGQGDEHIQKLKQLARDEGFDVPLYTVTGWDGTVYPKGEVLPVFGGYPDEPWGISVETSPPNEVYNFRFETRVAGNAGAQTAPQTKGTGVTDMDTTPFLGAEYAGGLPIMYRRRPVVQPEDIAAMLPVQLGSGVNLYGYYMFHGGRNPAGNTTLEENDLLGGYNGLPIINYDFQAPFGQYGQPHEVLNQIRPWHAFLNAFGDRLAPMTVHRPETEPKGRGDLETPRFSVRSSGQSGFVFMSNHVRQYTMAEQKNVQFNITLPGHTVTFPETPVSIEDGVSFVWPFNFDLDGVNLAWASAQPITRVANGDQVIYFFEAQPGVTPEFAFDEDVKALSGNKHKNGEHVIVSDMAASRSPAITLSGGKISIVVLSQADARNLTVATIAGKRRAILSKDLVFGDSEITLESAGDPNFEVGFFPSLEKTPAASLPLALVKTSGVFQTYRASAVPVNPTVSVEKIREAGQIPPVNIGGPAKSALQPYPETYGKAAAWKITVSPGALKGISDVRMAIKYRGDVGRLFKGAEMVDDQFWYGPDWTIGLARLGVDTPFTLNVLPLRTDAPIYLDKQYRPAVTEGTQIADVQSVTLTPVYRLQMR